ncbi:MAG: endonuclease III [Hyphomonadaceae bacterium]|nr:endonuclease III [Hyphomonadaceae bacterium]
MSRSGLLTKKQAAEVFARLAKDRPDPRTELDYSDPFTLLVSVVLSAQATDVSVNKATPALFKAAPTPQKMADLGAEGIAPFIKTIGLWRMKAKNVAALSRTLIEEHNGEVPRDRDALQALPGVGRKTANVVLAEAFGEGTIAVDTHVFRVSNRIGLSKGKTPDQVEAHLMRLCPPEYLRGAHHWLILHGRYVCQARLPDCPACAVRDLCRFRGKTTPESPARPAASARGSLSVRTKPRAKKSAAAGAKTRKK